MKSIKILLKDWGFWVIIYALIATFLWVLFLVKWVSYECPAPKLPELTKEHVEQIKEISNAKDKTTLDSLLVELYGFKSD